MALAAHVVVDQPSITAYGTAATTIFGQMSTELTTLISDVVEVKYEAPTATQFKRETGNLAVAFANALHKDMNAMAASVTAAVTSIAGAFDATSVTIEVANKAITAPSVPETTTIDLETAGLIALKDTVDTRFKAIIGFLVDHKDALDKTIWEGNAKERAKGEVNTLTTHSTQQCEQAQKDIKAFIDTQLDNVSITDA
ncbi:MAG: hypothetical protein WA964_07885 [Ilumatobacter sp.]|uniref:hypothetical protein n=1 Tax=Ilumatobacter sp. TaxID=1967498 RepID=UPI003C770080